MCSRFLSIAVLAAWPLVAAGTLRVCADPDNLPYSNRQGEGFENKLAEIIARDLGETVDYTWWSQRRSFLKNSLGADRCDVVMGVPAELGNAAVTSPYYRSTYVFVTRADRALAIHSLDDSRLGSMKIGIHMAGEDYTPPAVLLGRRGLAANLRAYRLTGAYGEQEVAGRLVQAVASGDVDVAVVWGPIAGFYANRQYVPLRVEPITDSDHREIPLRFSMAMAARKGDEQLMRKLNDALARNCTAIQSLLSEYHVPRVEDPKDVCVSLPHSPVLSH